MAVEIDKSMGVFVFVLVVAVILALIALIVMPALSSMDNQKKLERGCFEFVVKYQCAQTVCDPNSPSDGCASALNEIKVDNKGVYEICQALGIDLKGCVAKCCATKL
ncbi:MAG: hypothetical protein V1731_01930 [Candidatus Aenigmatarchaeota archaeon]